MIRLRLSFACFLTAVCFPQPALAVSSGEVYTSTSYGYGRFEARLRFAAGDGVVSSFFLWKDGSEVAGTFWNELDFEKLGADCHVETNSIYGNPSANHIQRIPPDADACGEYHTYAYEWTPEYIAWFIDEVEVRRDTGADAAAYADNAAAGMQLRFNVWPGDATFGGNFSPAILPVHQYVDWVQFSSHSAGAFTLAWREDFDSGALPSGWASANWGSPKNLSTHDPRNVNFIDGYLVISLTADDAIGPAGAVPQVRGSGGAAGSGGTGGMQAEGGTGPTAGSGGSMAAGAGGTPGSAGSSGSAGNAPGAGGSAEPPAFGGAAGASGSTSSGASSGGAAGAAVSGGTAPTMAQGGAAGVAGASESGGTGAASGDAPANDGGCSVSAPNTRASNGLLGTLGMVAILFGRRVRARLRQRRSGQ